MAIDGLCLQAVAIRVSVKKQTTVIKMLETLQKEQTGLNKPCYAPCFDIRERLNTGKDGDGDMAEEIITS